MKGGFDERRSTGRGMQVVYSNGRLQPGLEEAVKNKKTDYTTVRKDLLKATLQREIEECKARERAEREKTGEKSNAD